MSETVKVTREVYKELMDIWVDVDELPEEYELIKFYKDGMPEGWKDTNGKAEAGTTQAGTGVWVRLDDHGTSENWEEFKKEVEKARENINGGDE